MDPLKGAVAKLPGLDPAPLAFAVKLVKLVFLFFVFFVFTSLLLHLCQLCHLLKGTCEIM